MYVKEVDVWTLIRMEKYPILDGSLAEANRLIGKVDRLLRP